MSAAHSQVVQQLRSQLRASQPAASDRCIVSSGFDSLDQILPERGIPAGSLIEWVSDGPGMRTTSVAIKIGSQFLKRPGAFAIVDPLQCLNATAFPHLGLPLNRLLLVRPDKQHKSSRSTTGVNYHLPNETRADALWSLEQLARCTGVGVVLTWIDRLSSTAQRRLQLAVEHSGATVFLIRPQSVLNQPTWADLRFHVKTCSQPTIHDEDSVMIGSNLEVRLVRSKNSVHRHGNVKLECEHETGVVSETKQLARSEAAKPSAD